MPNSHTPRISICIPTVRTSTISYAIRSIIRQTEQDWELIVIGQGPRAELEEMTLRFSETDPRIKYIHSDVHGLSHARNAGARTARAGIVAYTDDDCEADQNWIRELLKSFDDDPTIVSVSGSLIAPPGLRRSLFSSCPECIVRDAVYDASSDRGNPPNGYSFVGGNIALRQQVFERIGTFDSHLGAGTNFPAAEDTDFLLRLELAGARLRSSSTAIVQHTYGIRSGLSSGLRHMRNYSRGNGALAAKLTLQGDPRGLIWKGLTWDEGLKGWIKDKRPERLAIGLVRIRHFLNAYNECLTNFSCEAGMLVPKAKLDHQAIPAQ